MAKVALVTGGSRGIGEAISKGLKAAGYSVAASYAGNDEAAAKFTAETGIKTYKWDVSDYDSCVAGIAKVEADLGPVDILVNNAGIMRAAMMGMISDADVSATLDLNLASPLHLIQAAARLMARTGGSIVNLSSVVGLEGAAGQLAYAASKAGVVGLTRAAAKELAPKGVRVNAVAPGYIETDMTAHLGEAVRAQSLQSIGLGRAGTPDDVADVVLFLCSDLSRYMTGQVLRVDGGMVI